MEETKYLSGSKSSHQVTNDDNIFTNITILPKRNLMSAAKNQSMMTPELTGRKTNILSMNYLKQKSMVVQGNPSGKMTVMNLKFTAKASRRSIMVSANHFTQRPKSINQDSSRNHNFPGLNKKDFL